MKTTTNPDDLVLIKFVESKTDIHHYDVVDVISGKVLSSHNSKMKANVARGKKLDIYRKMGRLISA